MGWPHACLCVAESGVRPVRGLGDPTWSCLVVIPMAEGGRNGFLAATGGGRHRGGGTDLSVSGVLGCPEPNPLFRDDRAARSQSVVDDVVGRDTNPGCAAAIGERGQVVWEGQRGIAVVDSATPITAQTSSNIGSVSKQFTALAVARSPSRDSCRSTTRWPTTWTVSRTGLRR